MRQVKNKRNKSTELKLIQFFKVNNIVGWRRNYPIFGKPDFVFVKPKVAVFVDGCFWHGHNCRGLKPASNTEYWTGKINRNICRDVVVKDQLMSKGWKVLRIWECELKHNDSLLDLFANIGLRSNN